MVKLSKVQGRLPGDGRSRYIPRRSYKATRDRLPGAGISILRFDGDPGMWTSIIIIALVVAGIAICTVLVIKHKKDEKARV